jgi:hypothetical protein
MRRCEGTADFHIKLRVKGNHITHMCPALRDVYHLLKILSGLWQATVNHRAHITSPMVSAISQLKTARNIAGNFLIS